MKSLNSKRWTLSLLFILTNQFCFGQGDIIRGLSDYNPNVLNSNFVWGIGLKTSVVISATNQTEIRVSAVGAIAKPMGQTEFRLKRNDILPSYHLELELHRGGMGAALGTKNYNNWALSMRNSFLVTFGFEDVARVAKPIPHFMGYSARALNDPYKYSFRLGTTFARDFTFDRTQRIGVVAATFDNVSIDYHNDGASIQGFLGLGDNYDRWWTGSGELSIFATNRFSTFQRLSLGFDRFTGFYPYSYESATALGLYYVPYPKRKEQLLNQGRWVFGGDFNNGTSVQMHFMDYPLASVQNIIHWLARDKGGMAFHPSALARRFGVGIIYQNKYETLY